MMEQAGWKVQPKKKIDFNAGPGIYVIRHGLGVDLEEMVEAVEPSLKDHHRLKLKQLRSLLERSG